MVPQPELGRGTGGGRLWSQGTTEHVGNCFMPLTQETSFSRSAKGRLSGESSSEGGFPTIL